MLQELAIKNLAIIENLILTFKPGLNVLTGETGAGKSIIVDALSLALGERASSEILKYGADEGSVQALFDIENIENINLPESLPLEDSSIILKRIISSSGKNRAYINENLVNLSTLQSIGSLLVDIHSQHEHQSLMNKERQLELLDSFGVIDSLKKEYSEVYTIVTELKERIRKIEEDLRYREQRADLLRYQINEITKAGLRPDEEESLRKEYAILKNSAKLLEAVNLAHSSLYESENSCIVQIAKTINRLKELAHIDPELQEVVEIISQAKPLIEETSRNLSALREKYNIDPRRLDYLNERLDLIERLKKKYGPSVQEILYYLEKAKKELEILESSENVLSDLKNELAEKEGILWRLAEEISDKRRETARRIEEAMKNELKEVALDKAIFRINIRRLPELSKNGIDDIEFEFSANPGEPPRSMTKIASGGELSRLMLCLKVILAEVDRIPVLIFDEVDAGIGGTVADKVGQRLKKLSKNRQILCITHLPQIASRADHHIKVEKVQKKNSVEVKVKSLSETERQEEIARMLSGKITDASLRHARELLKES
ncbi:MAG: DNA repair protein RecN [Thermodesulfovibrionales bacterium]|nr:DNA repair protein RecN [Thermodesulfovibrionales bacterium]